MKQIPPHHRIEATLDGSSTLFSERFQESCHSNSGARAETLLHYVEGCQVNRKKNILILEVGFGLGLGFLTTLEVLKNDFHFVSLEIDRELIEWFRTEHLDHPLLRRLTWVTPTRLELITPTLTLKILVGDARLTLKNYIYESNPQWDAIYQDAFSLKKNPTLWTQEWFELLKKSSAPDALISTYASGESIRKAMIAAGWKLTKGPGFGKKRSSTRASLEGETHPEILQQLKFSPVPALRDDNIEEILRK